MLLFVIHEFKKDVTRYLHYKARSVCKVIPYLTLRNPWGVNEDLKNISIKRRYKMQQNFFICIYHWQIYFNKICMINFESK